jgi:hypothetical protein
MGNGENDPSDRMGVLGIALVMEEVGKGARLVSQRKIIGFIIYSDDREVNV